MAEETTTQEIPILTESGVLAMAQWMDVEESIAVQNENADLYHTDHTDSVDKPTDASSSGDEQFDKLYEQYKTFVAFRR